MSDKSSIFEKISLIEQDRVATSDTKMTEIFNDYFSNIVPDLGLKIPVAFISPYCECNIYVEKSSQYHLKIILKHCKNHFFFKGATLDDVINEL